MIKLNKQSSLSPVSFMGDPGVAHTRRSEVAEEERVFRPLWVRWLARSKTMYILLQAPPTLEQCLHPG